MDSAGLPTALIRSLLTELHNALRDKILTHRIYASAGSMSSIAEVTSADTVYAIDKVSEDFILQWLEAHWPVSHPVEVVMEGLEDRGFPILPASAAEADPKYKLLIDPIDGTRVIMYDKRSAWILTGLAPWRGDDNTLDDIEVAVMTEIPTTRSWRSDQISGVRGYGIQGTITDVHSPQKPPEAFRPSPSTAEDLDHSFASIVKYFPEGRGLTVELENALFVELFKGKPTHSPLVFDDQYISTGGQFYEILCGHDRFIADIRPMVFQKLGLNQSLSCHPYDACCALILKEAGCIIEQPDGSPLKVPMDTLTPTSWAAYANPTLANKIRPILQKLIQEKLTG
jgi:hypothetical protein